MRLTQWGYGKKIGQENRCDLEASGAAPLICCLVGARSITISAIHSYSIFKHRQIPEKYTVNLLSRQQYRSEDDLDPRVDRVGGEEVSATSVWWI